MVGNPLLPKCLLVYNTDKNPLVSISAVAVTRYCNSIIVGLQSDSVQIAVSRRPGYDARQFLVT